MVVVITGASAGIGKALAVKLSAKGARLVLSARRLDRLHALNQQLGCGHLCISADVSRPEECARLIDESMKHFGRIDTLVCNSGYGLYKPVHETSAREYRDIFNTNIFGTVDCILAAMPHLLAQQIREGWRAQIMIVSSIVALHGTPFLGAYSATKSAQLSIAQSMRVELAGRKIAVTSVHPIQTKTDFGKSAEAASPIVMPKSPAGQTAEQVANAMVSAIVNPVAEVFPHRASKYLFSLGSLVPSLADWALTKFRNEILKANPKLRAQPAR